MIYTVECSFSDPASEAEWNHFYSHDKLPALISVAGFHTSQRFKALGTGGPVYLALHSIDSPEVLSSEEYRRKGGGNFARWQEHISDWQRNLYSGLDRAPDIGSAECLAISDQGPESLLHLGLKPVAVQAIGLDRFPASRWVARLAREQADAGGSLPDDIRLYAPMTAQLTSAAPASAPPQA